MKDHCRITISDLHGTRYYNVKKILFRYFAYAAIFLLVLLTISGAIISYLSHRVSSDQLKVTRLKSDIETLTTQKQNIQQSLQSKGEELVSLDTRMNELEQALGLNHSDDNGTIDDNTPPDTQEMQHRLETMASSSALRAMMMRLIPNGKPINYTRISSPFGYRIQPIRKKRERHPGMDLVAPRGTPVYAPTDGVVEYVRPGNKGYGNFIILDHSFGFTTLYAHLKKFNVKTNQFVQKGDLIAWSGNTGDSTGPHLHYEVRFLSRVLDPQNFMEWSTTNFTTLFKKEKHVKWASLVTTINQAVQIPQQLLSRTELESKAPSH